MAFFYGFGMYIPCLRDIWICDRGILVPGIFDENSTAGYIVTILCGLCSIVIPYLLGSINPAILISKLKYHDDIRTHGSGNAGSTNMLRTYGKGAALATLLCDFGKAIVATLLGFFFFGAIGGATAGFFVVFGHAFPAYYRLRGGKGVATLAMVALVMSPVTLLILVALFIVIVAGTKYVSLASVMCAMLYPLILNAFAGGIPFSVAFAIFSSLLVIFMHRQNIVRLWHGEESKISFSKKSSDGKESK